MAAAPVAMSAPESRRYKGSKVVAVSRMPNGPQEAVEADRTATHT